MRKQIIWPFLALTAIALSSSVNAETVTFSAPAGSAKSVLAGLAKKLNLELEVSKPLQWSVILVQVKDMDRELLFKKIADVTSGEWEKTIRGYRLNLSGEKDRQDRKREIGREMALLTERIRIARESLKSYQSSDESSLLDMLQAIDSAEIANIQPECRKVFTFTPNRMQLRLPDQARKILEDVLSKRRSATQEANAPNPSKVLFIVRRVSSDTLQLSLNLFDSNLKPILRLGGYYPWKEPKQPHSIELKNGDAKIVLGSTTLAYLKGLVNPLHDRQGRTSMRGGSLRGLDAAFYDSAPQPFLKDPLPHDLKTELEDPVAYDPLRRGASEALSQLALAQDVDLVGCIPDSCLIESPKDLQKTGLTAELVGQYAIQNWHLDLMIDGGVLIVKPSYAAQARDGRLDRSAMKELIDAEQKSGLISFSQFASYFGKQPCDPINVEPEYRWFRLLHPDISSRLMSIFGGQDRFLISIYARIPASQQQALWAGKTLATKSLTNAQRAILDRLIQGEQQPYISEDLTRRLESAYGDNYQNSAIECEPTEMLSSGYRLDGLISIAYQTKDIVIGLDKNGIRVPSDTEGHVSACRVNRDWVMLGEPLKYPSYQMGKRMMIRFTIPLVPDAFYETYFADDQCDSNSQQFTFDQLPDSYRNWFNGLVKEASDARERVRKLDEDQSGKGV